MASTGFSVTFDLGGLDVALRQMSARAPAIMARAMNRAAVAGQTAMSRKIAEDTGLAVRYVKREITVDKANRTNPVAVVTVKGARLPLIAFSARGPEPSRGRGRGVSYRLPTGRGRIGSAFIATMKSGHRGVFKRREKGRLPVDELRGPSIPHVFEKHFDVFKVAAQEALVKNLAHELDFEQNRPAAEAAA